MSLSLPSIETRRWLLITIVLLLSIWLCTTPLAASQPSNLVLKDLASDDYLVRQQATERLLADDQIHSDYIAQLYAHAKLPEQNHRLLNIARHHAIRQMINAQYGNEGQGAIGITHEAISADQSTVQGQSGIVVLETFPGFPGHAYLRRGDVILSIDDTPFPSGLSSGKIAEHFVASVKSHPCGTTVRFSVYRNGHTLQIQFPLASFDALKSAYNGPENLQQPFLDSWLAIRRNMLNSHRRRQQLSKPQLINPNADTSEKDTNEVIQDSSPNR